MMTSPRLPKLRELNPDIARVYPPCRTLARYRSSLGLSQTRYVAVAITASLDIPESLKERFTAWLLSDAAKTTWCDAPIVSRIESGEFGLNRDMQVLLDRVADHFKMPISDRFELREARESLNVSQSRFAVICLVELSDLDVKDKERIVSLIIRFDYACPFAGSHGTVSNIETGTDKKLSSEGMQAFLNGINLARRVAGLSQVDMEMLFDDYLAAVDEGH